MNFEKLLVAALSHILKEKFERKQVRRYSSAFLKPWVAKALYEWVADTSRALSTLIIFIS